jgi:hypothetical protein
LKTSELVDQLVILHNGWNRDGDHGVIRYLDMANKLLVSIDAEQHIVLDDEGNLPALNTNADEKVYDVEGRRVIAVVVDNSDIVAVADYGKRISTQNSFIFGSVNYTRIPYIKTTDRKNSTVPARVIFTKEPGVTTDYYRVVMYKVPVDILSESIDHGIKDPYDIQYLLPAASALISGVQNYTLAESLQYVKEVIMPAYSKELGEGDQGEYDSEPVSRGF